MKIEPLNDRVVIKRDEQETRSTGGIVIPDSASKEKPDQGKVVSVGPGKLDDAGKHVKPAVKKGDRILFGKYAGNNFKLDGDELVVLREDDILAIIK